MVSTVACNTKDSALCIASRLSSFDEAVATADLAFEGLKSILGIPAVSVAASALQPSYSTEEEAFQQVGLHAWQSQGGHPADDLNPASPALLQTAARAYLSRSQTKVAILKILSIAFLAIIVFSTSATQICLKYVAAE